ncbi:hypothetical protein HNY73_011166 [Argiope bruennichi]|uniref:Uncharacterized protein n=1 Tax=Argiope bruennichi TaxID=94029 RepID=A0A8T0F480_ARGBR|nr:hypothetical protein HNY73_011166 [Argiope bruennichi]
MENVKLNNDSIVDAMHTESGAALREDTPASPMEPASCAALSEDTPLSPMEQKSCSALMENECDALREKSAAVKAKSYIVLRFIKNRKFTLKLNFSKKIHFLNSEMPQIIYYKDVDGTVIEYLPVQKKTEM